MLSVLQTGPVPRLEAPGGMVRQVAGMAARHMARTRPDFERQHQPTPAAKAAGMP